MTAPAEILSLPKPGWVSEDVAILYDMAHRFMSEEIAPRYDAFEKNEMVDGFGIGLHNAIAAPYILHYDSKEQKKKWLPKLAIGELIGAIAMTEPGAGSDLQGVKTRAEKRQRNTGFPTCREKSSTNAFNCMAAMAT